MQDTNPDGIAITGLDEHQKKREGWVHPTGREPKTVLVVGLGPTKQDLLELTTIHEPNPRIMDVDEVWGINGGANHLAGRVAYSLVWVMDHIEGEARREPIYGKRLADWMDFHEAPIITSQAHGEWLHMRHMHEYPLREVVNTVGVDNAYFHNSIPYILAYALFIGVEDLVMFGCDYAHERIKRREDDRPNAEYWVGFCRARGMRVYLPDTTTLCNANRGPWFYGYRDQPLHVLKNGG